MPRVVWIATAAVQAVAAIAGFATAVTSQFLGIWEPDVTRSEALINTALLAYIVGAVFLITAYTTVLCAPARPEVDR